MLFFSRWKVIAILSVCLLGMLLTAPNFFARENLTWLPQLFQRQIALGLDLRGGAHLLIEVDTASLVRERLEAVRDDARKLLREARVGYTGLGLQGQSVQVRITDPAKVEEAKTKLGAIVQNLSGAISLTPVYDVEITQPEANLIRLTMTPAGIDYRARRAVEQSTEVIRRRIDPEGVKEPIIARQGAARVLVQVPGEQDTERLKKLITQTARLTFHMVEAFGADALEPGRANADSMVLYSRADPPVPLLVQARPLIVGDDLVDAQPTFDQKTSEPAVSFRLTTAGGIKFAEISTANVGRAFAIVLDKDVISYPSIREPITGGSGQISGNFTVQEANDLALLLRAGALPANLTVVEERTVGAGLGADSIKAAQIAMLVGTGLIVAFMVASYGMLGVFACVGMTINVMFTFSLLTLLGATLTLPGIAGIVLSVGMAVDANVLIYERIREEQQLGRTAINAIDTGFRKAMDTIIDANLTLLIASIALYFFGTGSIKGFAITLGIGNVTSFFTAVTVTRLIAATWVKYARPTRVPL